MGIRGFVRDFRMFRNMRSVSLKNGMRGMDFMHWVGNACHNEFTIDLTQNTELERAYKECSPLSTVINRNAMALANGIWSIEDEEGNDKLDSFKWIKTLLGSPNPLQSWTQFIIQLDVYRQIYGEVFVYAVVPVGLNIESAKAFWVIRPTLVDVETTKRLYFQSDIKDIVKAYKLCIDDNEQELNQDHVLHIKDTFQNLNFNPDNIRGCSRISGLEYDIRNVMQAYEAIYSLNKDRGAQGILSNISKDAVGAMPMSPIQKEELQQQYNTNYGLGESQRKVIITDASVNWQSMSYSVKDLMLYEGIKSNIEQIADAFGYPKELLSIGDQSIYNNKNEGNKNHYQGTVIPTANMYEESFSKFLGLKDYKFEVDYSHIECMQEGREESANTKQKLASACSQLYKDGVITKDEYRIELGFNETALGTNFISNEKK